MKLFKHSFAFRKIVCEAERIPVGYGRGWYDISRRQTVCFPIGFNYLIGLARSLYLVIKRGIIFGDTSRDLSQAYRRGYEDSNRGLPCNPDSVVNWRA